MLMAEPPALPPPPSVPPPRSLQFITTLLSLFVLVIALSLAVWLAWSERLIPHEWFVDEEPDVGADAGPPNVIVEPDPE